MNHVSNPLEGIEVHALDFFNLPSPHIKPKHMLALYHKIKEEADHYDGVVITHGTDTLEETAYFLDTMEIPHMPIVLTGAMRSSNELGSDGVYNYLSALRVASDDKAADKGVLVVMNDEIHAAKYVTKNPYDQRRYLSNSYSRASRSHHEARNPLLQNSRTASPF